MTRAGCALAVAVASVILAPVPTIAAMPSTFGPVIGNAILCRSHLENAYFYNYLETAFGKSYKHEGGAYWFKTPDTTLWGADVKQVWVSDDTSELIFIGALTESEPDKLADAVKSAVGLRYPVQGAGKYPLRVSALGSSIAYVNKKSKIYCARYKPLPAG